MCWSEKPDMRDRDSPAPQNRVVYQLLRFLGLGPRGCGLESHLPYYFAPLVEFGRHAGPRNQCRNAYRFESDRGYKRKDPIVQWIECFATDEEIGIRVLVGSLRHGYSLKVKTDGSFPSDAVSTTAIRTTGR